MAVSKTEKNRQDRVGSGDFIYTIDGLDQAPAFISFKDAYEWMGKYVKIPHTYKTACRRAHKEGAYIFEGAQEYRITAHKIA